MAIYWPTPGFKGRTFKLCVLTRCDVNFCVRSSPLQGSRGTFQWQLQRHISLSSTPRGGNKTTDFQRDSQFTMEPWVFERRRHADVLKTVLTITVTLQPPQPSRSSGWRYWFHSQNRSWVTAFVGVIITMPPTAAVAFCGRYFPPPLAQLSIFWAHTTRWLVWICQCAEQSSPVDPGNCYHCY